MLDLIFVAVVAIAVLIVAVMFIHDKLTSHPAGKDEE